MSVDKRKDIIYMNYMKFFGIVYLLIWHTGIKNLNIFVISFFLQMFFFISGYFYKDTYSEKPLIFLCKRIVSLYIPFVIYCLLFLILNNLFVKLGIYEESMIINYSSYGYYIYKILTFNPSVQMAGAMWFITAIFMSSIIFCGMSALIKKIYSLSKNNNKNEFESIRFFFVSALYLLGNYLSIINLRLPLYLDISIVLTIFYYLGYLYRIYEEKITFNVFIALSSFLSLIVCTKYGFPQFIQRKYIDPSFILLCGISGIYLNIYISKKCASFKEVSFINYAGRNTMAILALHFLSFKIVSFVIIYLQGLPVDLLSSFPVIKNMNQCYRVIYMLSGLVVPLFLKYLFDISFSKLKSIFLWEQFIKPDLKH